MKSGKLFWGLICLFAAAYLILNQLFILPGGLVRLAMAAVFLLITIKGLAKMNFTEILLPIAGILILYRHEFLLWFGLRISPWTILTAAVLAGIGLSMIFGGGHRRFRIGDGKGFIGTEEDKEYREHSGKEHFERVENGTDHARIHVKAIFGSVVKYVNTDCFEHAFVECSFGGMKIFFDNAKIPSGNAIIDLGIAFGGAELYLPKEWTLVNRAHAVFGGIEEKNQNGSVGGPTVTLTGNVNFGGVTVIYV
ncbi:membrane protein [Clostridia bacterium]|nr:membrane protein [Clostridia bacterium]